MYQDEEEQWIASLRSERLPIDLPGYEVVEMLGRGSFGTVYSGIQKRTGQSVALKVLRRENFHWETFKHELERLKQVTEHPNIVTLLDADLEHDPPYFVMPLLSSGSLESACPPEGPLPEIEEVVIWLEQILEALNFMHRNGIFHCDLKPSNVLLDVQGKARLVDFGQACRDDEEAGSFGTLGYMPPEQAQARARPHLSWDVYGFGAMAYRLLTGHCPRFNHQDRTSLTHANELSERLRLYRELVAQKPLEPLTRLNPKVDPDLAAIVESCLEVDPLRRSLHLQQVAEDFQRRRSREPLLCRRPWSLRYQLVRFLSRPTVGVSLLVALSLPLFVNSYLTYKAHRAISLGVKLQAHQVNSSALHHWQQLSPTEKSLEKLYRGQGFEHLILSPKREVLRASSRDLPELPSDLLEKYSGEIPAGFFESGNRTYVAAWRQSEEGTFLSLRPAEQALAPADDILRKNGWLNFMILFVAGLSALVIVRFSGNRSSPKGRS